MNREIVFNIVNSLLAGFLVLLGALASGEITGKSLCAAAVAGLIVAITQFKRYWELEAPDYCSPALFTFIGAYKNEKK